MRFYRCTLLAGPGMNPREAVVVVVVQKSPVCRNLKAQQESQLEGSGNLCDFAEHACPFQTLGQAKYHGDVGDMDLDLDGG